MGKNWKSVIGFFIVFSAGTVPGSIILDPMWMFSDSGTQIYGDFRYCDTTRDGNFFCREKQADQIPDTGDSYNGSQYINLDYKFTNDSLFVVDEFDPGIIHYRDWRPGFAGFKTAWDLGMVGFNLSRYKYLIFAHKGPTANQKVRVRCWYNNGNCGAESYNEYLGAFTGSTSWKVDTIVIPDAVQNKSDPERNRNIFYELVFLITNLDSNDVTPGGPWNLKIDNIRLAGCNPIDTSPAPQQVNAGAAAAFHVATSRADSADILTYQWRKDGADIAGATGKVYSIALAKQANAGVYTVAVKVSGSGLTFTSQSAALTVLGADPVESDGKGCGCGAGTGLALIPPFLFKAMAHRNRKRKR
jgi:hypothetical protein